MSLCGSGLRYADPKDFFFFFNYVISVICTVLRETTVTISLLTGEPVSKEFEIVKVVSLGTMEISEIHD